MISKSWKLGWIGLAVALFSTASFAFDFFQPVTPPRTFQFMVHRGMMCSAPENTRPALEMLIEDHIEWAEVDVRLTKDGHHVLFHDWTLDGKTNGEGKVGDRTLAEIRELDAGAWFAPRFAGEKILTLEECLSLCKNRLNLYLDCKEIDPQKLVEEILAAGMEKQVAVFDDLEILLEIRGLSEGKIAIMPKWHPEDGLEEWVAKVRPDVIEVNADEITPDVCQAFHKLGVEVQVQTLGKWDCPEFWKTSLEAGVDYFQTDFPGEILAFSLRKRFPKWPVEFSLHRGALRYAPENTPPAFEKAIRLGADFVEFDVRTSKDGSFFLLHDGSLDRTTNGTVEIEETQSQEILKLDAGSWFSKQFAGLRVPTFEDFLKEFSGRVEFYCDAKDIPPQELAKALDRHGMANRTVVYQSVDYLAELREIDPRIRSLPPLGDPKDIEATHARFEPYAFDTSWGILSKELIERCHGLGIKVFSDAMGGHDTVEDFIQAIDWGIDLIQTDRPLVLLRAVELHTARSSEKRTE
jgi:glycerophosphoryl diester phosphodiesterase